MRISERAGNRGLKGFNLKIKLGVWIVREKDKIKKVCVVWVGCVWVCVCGVCVVCVWLVCVVCVCGVEREKMTRD